MIRQEKEKTVFGEDRLLKEDQLRAYAGGLQCKTDDELVEESRSQIHSAALLVRHSTHDQKATKCWEESERRGRPWLYQRGYNRAVKEAGGEINASDLLCATEEHHAEKRT